MAMRYSTTNDLFHLGCAANIANKLWVHVNGVMLEIGARIDSQYLLLAAASDDSGLILSV
jgi:hypothetical protein